MLRSSAPPATHSAARQSAGYARTMLILQSSSIGGMESHCIELSADLHRRGSAVLAAIPAGSAFDPLATALRRRGASVERVDTDARRGRLAQVLGIARLTRIVHGFAPDVVHIHVGGATGGLGAGLVARLATRAVVVMTEHDVPSANPGLGQRVSRRLLDATVDVLIAVSRHNAKLRLSRLGAPAGKMAVVLNGAPIPAISPSACASNRAVLRSRLGIAADATVIGSVLRLAPGKGLPTLLKAFAIFLERQDARLLVVGSGPLEADLRKDAAGLGIEDRVIWAGYQADPGLFVDAMDIFVLAVPVGSGSIALLEAMARGKPPVITFGNGEEAVVPEKTGLWAPPDEPASLAAALLRLASHPDLRERLGRAAARHVRRHYSSERCAEDLIDVYLAARHGSIPPGLRASDATDRHPGLRQLGVARL